MVLKMWKLQKTLKILKLFNKIFFNFYQKKKWDKLKKIHPKEKEKEMKRKRKNPTSYQEDVEPPVKKMKLTYPLYKTISINNYIFIFGHNKFF